MMAKSRPWEGQLAESEERPRKPKLVVDNGPKGPPPPRQCPPDFDVIFVEVGRKDCEGWYRASRVTIDRWLKERGKKRLIKARAAFVSHERSKGTWITRQSRLVEERKPKPARKSVPVRDRRKVKSSLARLAAQHLRILRHGGWIVSPTGQGDWFVGSRRVSAGALLAYAQTRGFDVKAANLQIRREEEENAAHEQN